MVSASENLVQSGLGGSGSGTPPHLQLEKDWTRKGMRLKIGWASSPYVIFMPLLWSLYIAYVRRSSILTVPELSVSSPANQQLQEQIFFR